ncbi:M43 family zinc metalloprotease [Flavobacterium akiainvivens]|uniref:M43 family zinc metalloprotease n=1 Tax=Flavobacterium akiainvivens TaxID=1202724 RepID=UPI0006C832EC|nr:M43 family zinc metalloprotease [Flavobacterium akiainvivens]SFQ63259.1 Por secretion system C-terminal sorting domain-containing protein [Flavobacterium akiainvivens]
MITITHRAAAVVATGLFSLALHAQKQPKNQDTAKHFGQKEFISCGTVHSNAAQNQQKFEQWLAPKVAAAKAASLQKSGQNTNQVVTIPVVVHVIHNGDAIGQDENISDEQIFSQITVLNEDFRRMLNTPGYNTNPVGADMEIEFCLAQRDPNGLLSTGITRRNMGKATWEMDEVEVMKTQTQWDPEKYLNIWVVSQVTIQNIYLLAGYAQFPVQSGLEGLTGLPTSANTDGVVIGAPYFGSEEIYPDGFYEQGVTGRSATHEIGHYFGLRHIWGDAEACEGTDYCADTPVHATANQGCPPAGYDSCPDEPGVDMIANYMDYTSDACKNVFTADQKARMQAVLANSPRRASLITSDGCVPGLVYDNDGSLNLQINSTCGGDFEPSVVLKNNGNNTITSATFTYQVDEEAAQTYSWTGSLENGEEEAIAITGLTVAAGDHEFTTAMVTVNGVADQAPANDAITTPFSVAAMYNTYQNIIVTINTDDYGDETIWALLDSNDNFIASNANLQTGVINYYDSNETYVIEVPVQSGECYTFSILDLAGDGMCCDWGEGSYSVTTTAGDVIVEGGAFADQENTNFGIDSALGTNSFSTTNGISLYPNPANSVISIATQGQNTVPDSYTVYNSLGQVVGSGKISSNNHPVSISNYANGVYFIKLQSGTATQTLQFIKQ